MYEMHVNGSFKISGSVNISKSKNASLPIMIASILADGVVSLNSIPDLLDTRVVIDLLKHLGSCVTKSNNIVNIDSSKIFRTLIPNKIMSKMRASVLAFGPLLSKYGSADLYLPGGCMIGKRPINFHIKGLESMGCSVEVYDNFIRARVLGEKLVGANITLEKSSVGATENIMMAATIAEGVTTIKNAALEPEVVDLSNFLIKMGANISGVGTRELVIKGVSKLNGCSYEVIPDRIEMATYAILAAAVGGELCINNVNIAHVDTILKFLSSIGVTVKALGNRVKIFSARATKCFRVKTGPYPLIPSDVQALLMSLACVSDGVSCIEEGVFENRFIHVPNIIKIGGCVSVEKNKAIIKGNRSNLLGSVVSCTDIRGGAALVVAALAARGKTIIRNLRHLDRGYEALEDKLKACGIDIKRISV